MPILKQALTPGGAAVGFHVVERFEASARDSTQSVMVKVASWPSEEAYNLTGGMGATWNEWYGVPFAALSGSGNMSEILERALIAKRDGPFVDGSYVADGDGVEGLRARRWANIKQTRSLLDEAPAPLRDFQIDADAQSRQDVMGAILAMQLKGQTSRSWRCSDNTMRELSLEDLIELGTHIADRRQQLIEISDSLYHELQSARTAEEIDAIVWPST